VIQSGSGLKETSNPMKQTKFKGWELMRHDHTASHIES